METFWETVDVGLAIVGAVYLVVALARIARELIR